MSSVPHIVYVIDLSSPDARQALALAHSFAKSCEAVAFKVQHLLLTSCEAPPVVTIYALFRDSHTKPHKLDFRQLTDLQRWLKSCTNELDRAAAGASSGESGSSFEKLLVSLSDSCKQTPDLELLTSNCSSALDLTSALIDQHSSFSSINVRLTIVSLLSEQSVTEKPLFSRLCGICDNIGASAEHASIDDMDLILEEALITTTGLDSVSVVIQLEASLPSTEQLEAKFDTLSSFDSIRCRLSSSICSSMDCACLVQRLRAAQSHKNNKTQMCCSVTKAPLRKSQLTTTWKVGNAVLPNLVEPNPESFETTFRIVTKITLLDTPPSLFCGTRPYILLPEVSTEHETDQLKFWGSALMSLCVMLEASNEALIVYSDSLNARVQSREFFALIPHKFHKSLLLVQVSTHYMTGLHSVPMPVSTTASQALELLNDRSNQMTETPIAQTIAKLKLLLSAETQRKPRRGNRSHEDFNRNNRRPLKRANTGRCNLNQIFSHAKLHFA